MDLDLWWLRSDIHLRVSKISHCALVHLQSNDLERAYSILKNEALPLAKDECSEPAQASVRNRLAKVALERGEIEEAKEEVLKALEVRLGRKMFSEVARSLVLLGSIHFEEGHPERALLVWILSFNLQEAFDDHESLPETHYNLGNAYGHLFQKSI